MRSIFGVREPSRALKFVSVTKVSKSKSGGGPPQSKEPGGSKKAGQV
jgi:hypothetical protein